MKNKIITVATVLVLGGILFLFFRSTRSDNHNATVTDISHTNLASVAVSTKWPDDPRPEVKEFYQFAAVAGLYNFDPQVTGFRNSPTFRGQIDIGTSTHYAEYDIEKNGSRNRIRDVYSYRDDALAPIRDPGADPAQIRKSWRDCNGIWNKEEMIVQTLNILQQLGYTELLDIVKDGKRKFEPIEYIWLGDDGLRHTNCPFAKVTLSDEHGPRVIAEYRMGTNGLPAGLTHWTAR